MLHIQSLLKLRSHILYRPHQHHQRCISFTIFLQQYRRVPNLLHQISRQSNIQTLTSQMQTIISLPILLPDLQTRILNQPLNRPHFPKKTSPMHSSLSLHIFHQSITFPSLNQYSHYLYISIRRRSNKRRILPKISSINITPLNQHSNNPIHFPKYSHNQRSITFIISSIQLTKYHKLSQQKYHNFLFTLCHSNQ